MSWLVGLGRPHPFGRWDPSRPREVCSPWHVAMNSAMIVTGVLLALGVLLTWAALGRGVATTAARLLTLAAAGGYILAGTYPADVNENRHFLAALLIFALGIPTAPLDDRGRGAAYPPRDPGCWN